MSQVLFSENYKGYFATSAALSSAFPVGAENWWAIVQQNNQVYIWNVADEAWKTGSGGGGGGSVDSVTGNIVGGTATNPVVTQVQSDWNASSGLGEILNKPILANPNLLINGDFQVNQDNGDAQFAIGDGTSSLLVVTDGLWYGNSDGGNTALCQAIAGTASPKQLEITGRSGVTGVDLYTRIEADRAIGLVGKKLTFSVYTSNSLLNAVDLSIDYANAKNTFGTLASPNLTNIATETFTVSSTKAQFTKTSTVPSGAENGIQIRLSVGAQESGTWVIDRVKLEIGSQATDYLILDYSQALALCQRFNYQSWKEGAFENAGAAAFAIPVPAVASVAIGAFNFPVQMFGNPTITLYGEAGTPGTAGQPGYSGDEAAEAGYASNMGFGKITKSSGSYLASTSVFAHVKAISLL